MDKPGPRLIAGTSKLAWAALVLLLPLTSLPLLARLARTNSVAAPATIPLAILLIIWFIPYLMRGGNLPHQSRPFFGFVIVALVASAGAFFLDVPPFKDSGLLSEELPALLTLGIGSAFYLVSSVWPRSDSQLQTTLKLINWSGLGLVAWSLIQGYFIFFEKGRYPDFMVQFQALVSSRRLFHNRATGLAFEPSWLAHQLNMLYLPFWLAATVRRFSVHSFRVWKFSFENLLLAGGVIILAISFSRVGWLAFLLVVAYLLLTGSLNLMRQVRGRVLALLAIEHGRKQAARWLISAGLIAVLLGVYLGGTIGLVYAASRFDKRLEGIFQLADKAEGFYDLTNKLKFAERVVYWASGWEVFNDHPFVGVGLGNAGFFFPQKVPAFGWNLVEINDTLFRWTAIPNTKSFWARILAETGIVGFAFFITWYYVLWQASRAGCQKRKPIIRVISLAGSLVLIGFLIEGFSVDSFALPYLWFSLGLLTAAVNSGQKNHPKGD